MQSNLPQLEVLRYKCIACGYCMPLATDVLIFSAADGKIAWAQTPFCNDDNQVISDPLLQYDILQKLANLCPVGALKPISR